MPPSSLSVHPSSSLDTTGNETETMTSHSVETNAKEDQAPTPQQTHESSGCSCSHHLLYENAVDQDEPLTNEQIQAWLTRTADKETTTTNAPWPTRRRPDYLSWQDFFMATACLSALRSKEPADNEEARGGCCIVNPTTKRILAVGYTGFSKGASDDVLPWHAMAKNHSEDHKNDTNWLWTRQPYAVHAGQNAILNKANWNIQGAHMYLTHFPCNECTKVLIQAGVQKVIYQRDKSSGQVVSCGGGDQASSIVSSRIMMSLAGVEMETYRPSTNRRQVKISLQSTVANMGDESNAALSTTTKEDEGNNDHENNNINENDSENENDPRYQYRELMLQETRGYDPVLQPSGRRPASQVLGWTEYFLAFASLTAQRSKDPNTQVGACLVDSDTNRIVGLGYNGFPQGCSDDVLPWTRGSPDDMQSKYMYVCHAEVNAILNRIAVPAHTTLYVALFPCHACAQVIVQAGIERVVYQADKYHDTDTCRASRIILTMGGVELVPYQSGKDPVDITIAL